MEPPPSPPLPPPPTGAHRDGATACRRTGRTKALSTEWLNHNLRPLPFVTVGVGYVGMELEPTRMGHGVELHPLGCQLSVWLLKQH